MPVIVIMTLVLIGLGVLENALHQKAIKKIPLRILVNGTRGKTTVTRMTAAVLNAAGIATYAKTTGSEARRILPDGTETVYRREKHPVSMMEQLPFARLAARGKAQAIVVECMAQRGENQALMAWKLVRPNYVLITNAYVDHLAEIGATEGETVHILAKCIPDDANVIAADPRFGAYTEKLILPDRQPDMAAFTGLPYPVHKDNAALVMALAKQLNIRDETAVQGILSAKPDVGMLLQFETENACITNVFAANDPVSFTEAMADCARRGPYTLLFNHRRDRAYRLETFSKALKDCGQKPRLIAVIGDDKRFCARTLARLTGIPARRVDDAAAFVHSLPPGSQVLCAGNIKGEGRQLLQKLMGEAQNDV